MHFSRENFETSGNQFAHFVVRVLPGKKKIREGNIIRISLPNGKRFSIAPKESHQTFLLAALTLHWQTCHIDAPLSFVHTEAFHELGRVALHAVSAHSKIHKHSTTCLPPGTIKYEVVL